MTGLIETSVFGGGASRVYINVLLRGTRTCILRKGVNVHIVMLSGTARYFVCVCVLGSVCMCVCVCVDMV